MSLSFIYIDPPGPSIQIENEQQLHIHLLLFFRATEELYYAPDSKTNKYFFRKFIIKSLNFFSSIFYPIDRLQLIDGSKTAPRKDFIYGKKIDQSPRPIRYVIQAKGIKGEYDPEDLPTLHTLVNV